MYDMNVYRRANRIGGGPYSGPERPSMKQCPNCGFSGDDSDRVCRYCGTAFASENGTQPNYQYGPSENKENDIPYSKQPVYYPAYIRPARTNGLSIASMVLGIVSIFTVACWGIGGICAILSLIFGCVALSTIRTTGESGRGMAIAGIVTSVVAIVIGIALLALILLGAELSNSLSHNYSGIGSGGNTLRTRF